MPSLHCSGFLRQQHVIRKKCISIFILVTRTDITKVINVGLNFRKFFIRFMHDDRWLKFQHRHSLPQLLVLYFSWQTEALNVFNIVLVAEVEPLHQTCNSMCKNSPGLSQLYNLHLNSVSWDVTLLSGHVCLGFAASDGLRVYSICETGEVL